METIKTTHTMRTLRAADGHWLIDRSALTAAQTAGPAEPGATVPYMTRTVYLGSGDTPDRFTEITDAEAEVIRKKYEPAPEAGTEENAPQQ